MDQTWPATINLILQDVQTTQCSLEQWASSRPSSCVLPSSQIKCKLGVSCRPTWLWIRRSTYLDKRWLIWSNTDRAGYRCVERVSSPRWGLALAIWTNCFHVSSFRLVDIDWCRNRRLKGSWGGLLWARIWDNLCDRGWTRLGFSQTPGRTQTRDQKGVSPN